MGTSDAPLFHSGLKVALPLGGIRALEGWPTIRPEAANLTGHLVSLLPAFVAPRSTYLLGFPGWTCVCFTFSISRMTIIKTSTSYFACPSPATTAANLSSIWFQPST